MTELEAMIPSRTTRKFVEDTGYEFEDEDRISLIIHNKFLRTHEKIDALWHLNIDPANKYLADQLTGYLSELEFDLDQFKENQNSEYVYILKFYEKDKYLDSEIAEIDMEQECPSTYYSCYTDAYNDGVSEKTSFVIEKKGLGGVYHSHIRFDCDGNIIKTYSWDNYLQDLHESHLTIYCRFYNIPNPFKAGDIVKVVGSNEVGVVKTSRSELAQIAKNHRCSICTKSKDYQDGYLQISYLKDDGSFGRMLVSPANLEFYNSDEDDNSCVTQRELLTITRELYRGKGTVEELFESWKNHMIHILSKSTDLTL